MGHKSRMRNLLVIFALCVLCVSAKPAKKIRESSCGYETCHPVDNTKINVHLIPHSHDDVGWLKTVDQYFFGAKTNIQSAGVNYIITNTVQSLKANPNRRFIQVETEFFKKWWEEASDSLRQDFRDLVNNGQIEMINGAIAMNDEACTNYMSTIDQFTWGLRFLNDTLGRCGIPKIGWQIDPFGHSREQASLFTQFGFNGFFFSRLDENDRKNRKENRRLDFLWQGSSSLENNEIFGSIFPTSLYFPPNDLNWDVGATDDPVIDDPESPDYNVPKFLTSVKKTIDEYKNWFPTNNIIFPMGGDFQYQAAEMQFLNMDKLIKIFENNSDINVIYSTPSCYLKAVYDANPTLKLKTDDFFPYGNSDHEYWAGYFTSRPNSKRFERTGNNILQATKQLTALAKLSGGKDYTDDVNDLREEMGIMQHHDAITGTEKQHVTSDYVRRLTKGIRNAEEHLDEVIGTLLEAKLDGVNLQSCLLANVSICSTEKGNNVIVVYNPLSRPVSHYVRVPVADGDYIVTGSDSTQIKSNIVPAISSFDYIPNEVGTPLPNELVFLAESIPAFGLQVYYLEKSGETTPKSENKQLKYTYGDNVNGFTINSTTGLLSSVTIQGKTVEITQEFLYYESAESGIWSGAYLFRPKVNTTAKSLSESVKIKSVRSTDNVDEVVQVFNDYITQIIRVYKNVEHSYIEFDWLVGPLPIGEQAGMGNEIISRFTVSDFDNDQVFYTDSNGRELIRREINKRPDYTYDPSYEPIASNYYPVTSRILIRDEAKNLEVAVLNDRSQAGSSLDNGELELMVHRRLFHDDYKGVDENLNETEFGQGVVVRGSHYLTLGEISPKEGNSAAVIERELALRKLLAPLVLVGSTDKTKNEVNEINFEYVSIKKSLPDNVNVLTLEPWKDNSYILRLENIYESDENSNVATVDLNHIFEKIQFSNIQETTLAANQWLDEFSEIPKFSWTSDVRKMKGWNVDTSKESGSTITLAPMQIRTFIVEV
ncbi:lysosomal alpha-mannosidase-like isoform X2 [Aethina tumida]|uniref:lysosomal alpha-mannosidase-like isoform X2 n=1 Tax=Aethina tumida TaxID=116153 RepID=UPI002148B216|nr:lysosomal alpha-mannosidase-like isoform X2 [Aethina tumida]